MASHFSRVWGGLSNASRVWGGLGNASRVGARREGVGDHHHFILGFGCPREFWSSERAEGRGVLPLYKLSLSRGGIYIDRPSCRSYIEGVISTTTRHTYTWENNVIGEGVSVPPPRGIEEKKRFYFFLLLLYSFLLLLFFFFFFPLLIYFSSSSSPLLLLSSSSYFPFSSHSFSSSSFPS